MAAEQVGLGFKLLALEEQVRHGVIDSGPGWCSNCLHWRSRRAIVRIAIVSVAAQPTIHHPMPRYLLATPRCLPPQVRLRAYEWLL